MKCNKYIFISIIFIMRNAFNIYPIFGTLFSLIPIIKFKRFAGILYHAAPKCLNVKLISFVTEMSFSRNKFNRY